MSMLSNTQQRLFSQQNAHSVLKRKVEVKSEDRTYIKEKLENANQDHDGKSTKKNAYSL